MQAQKNTGKIRCFFLCVWDFCAREKNLFEKGSSLSRSLFPKTFIRESASGCAGCAFGSLNDL